MTDAIAVGDGFLAVGRTEDGAKMTGQAWRSDDGRSWERIDDPGIESMLPSRVLTVGPQLVILGLENSAGDDAKNLELWQSTDGRTWDRGATPPVPADPTPAAGGPAGILLPVGQDIWLLGPDLTSWTKTTTWPDDVYLGSPAWADGRWLQPGATGVVGANAQTTATIWSSTDGRTWQATSMNPSNGAVYDVYPAMDGFLAVGQSANLCRFCRGPLLQPRVGWTSSDGVTWQALQAQPGLPQLGDRIVSDGRRIVQIGPLVGQASAVPERPPVAESVDGASWHVLEQTGPNPDATQGAVAVGPHGVVVLPGTIVTQSFGPDEAMAWWGAGSVAPERPTPSAAPPADPTPLVTGCDAMGFDVRRCAAVVARAEQSIDNPDRVISILVRRPTGTDASLGSVAIATVDFTMPAGTTQSADVRCFLAFGPRSSDRACSADPQVWVAGGVSRDTPCGPTPGDETHACGPLPPDPAPASIANANPLILRTFDIPIDHLGHYEVLVGAATIPNGAISEIAADVGDPRPTGFWIDPYVRIEVRPDRGGPPIDTYYGRRVKGQLPVHVYLVFDVTELTDPRSVFEIRNLVVR